VVLRAELDVETPLVGAQQLSQLRVDLFCLNFFQRGDEPGLGIERVILIHDGAPVLRNFLS
jgi:hypothetical protein